MHTTTHDTTTQDAAAPERVRRRRGTRLLCCLGVVVVLAALPFAGSADARGPVEPAAPRSGLVPGTPCSVGTSACVQLGSQGFNARSWLIRDGRVVRGPIAGASGGPGKDTPTGTYRVIRKIEDHYSSETTDAEGRPSHMPYAVFYTKSGYAFHGGGRPSDRTAGCVRLPDSDASYFFRNLNPGDQVQIVDRSARVADDRRRDREDDDEGGLLGGL